MATHIVQVQRVLSPVDDKEERSGSLVLLLPLEAEGVGRGDNGLNVDRRARGSYRQSRNILSF